jgi:hypothetical protein
MNWMMMMMMMYADDRAVVADTASGHTNRISGCGGSRPTLLRGRIRPHGSVAGEAGHHWVGPGKWLAGTRRLARPDQRVSCIRMLAEAKLPELDAGTGNA